MKSPFEKRLSGVTVFDQSIIQQFMISSRILGGVDACSICTVHLAITFSSIHVKLLIVFVRIRVTTDESLILGLFLNSYSKPFSDDSDSKHDS